MKTEVLLLIKEEIRRSLISRNNYM